MKKNILLILSAIIAIGMIGCSVQGDIEEDENNDSNIQSSSNTLVQEEGDTSDISDSGGSISGINDTQGTQVINPYVEFETVEQAGEVLECTIPYPIDVAFDKIFVVNDAFVQLDFTNNGKEYSYRVGKGNDDISGDYNKYSYVKQIENSLINFAKPSPIVTISGENKKYSLATWVDDIRTYSITTTDASEEDIIEILSSLAEIVVCK